MPSTSIEAEITALRALAEAFDPLEAEARERVLAWLLSAYALRASRPYGPRNGQAKPPHTDEAKSRISQTMKALWKKKRAAPKRTSTPGYSGKMIEQRERTAELLESFDLRTPRAPVGHERPKIGVMVRRGYLARKGEGYIRTGKLFEVKPGR